MKSIKQTPTCMVKNETKYTLNIKSVYKIFSNSINVQYK